MPIMGNTPCAAGHGSEGYHLKRDIRPAGGQISDTRSNSVKLAEGSKVNEGSGITEAIYRKSSSESEVPKSPVSV